MRIVIVLLGLLVFSPSLWSQSQEDIKLKGIKTRQSWNNLSSTKKYLDKVEKYDLNGNLIEEIEYREDNTIKYHFIWTYNSDNNKLTETELDGAGNQVKKTVYEYNGNLKISKKEYNDKGKLVEWKTYSYDTK